MAMGYDNNIVMTHTNGIQWCFSIAMTWGIGFNGHDYSQMPMIRF